MNEPGSMKAQATRILAEGKGEPTIAKALGITRHRARALVLEITKEQAPASTALAIPAPSGLSHYDAARHALAIAKSLDEVMEIADKATAIKEYARRAKDRQLQIDATEIVIRSERRLGEMLAATPRHPPGPEKIGSDAEPIPPTLEEMGIDKKLSARSQKLASISERAIEARIANWREGAERGAERVTTDLLRTGDKRERRAARETHLGVMQEAGNLRLPAKRYGVILADPEWKFETWSPAGLDRCAANHYATSETAQIAARPVGDIAAKDCVLFLWATAPMLPHALHVMVAWGFEYKSHRIWDKVIVGTGYWFRNVHELLLVGTRGDIPAPAPGAQPLSLFKEQRREHSQKPEQVHQMIDDWFPHLPKIELNARKARDGWDSWGLEAPQRETEAAE